MKPSQSPEIDSERGSYLAIDDVNNSIALDRKQKGVSDFTFSGVVGPNGKQDDLFVQCNLARDVLEGINCCVMAYGQTGSGKTFSMYGKGWDDTDVSTQAENGDSVAIRSNPTEEDFGIIPRTINEMFESLEKKAAASEKFDFSVNCQIMQIYNEKIFDLLQDRRRENPLQLREAGKSASSTVHVKGLSIYQVYSKEDVMALLRRGQRNRAIRATDFNQESSRSHTILQLYVQVEEEDDFGLMVLKRATFSLVDLAG